ncbi:hypothetical protein GCM10028778_15070 [Barrientosiimonas marina]|uniref:Uncharacterized protein n=1 Tax=Lentibacillus kimchii TaxID=1542911 RepID=A0ABW2UU55_9BACI
MHDTDDVSTSLMNISANFEGRVMNRIYPFHILCIYNSHEKQDYLKRYAKRVISGAKDDLRLFSHEQEGESFIISQTSYQQNQGIFSRIRTQARDDVFNRIATGITAYFLKKYTHLIQSSMSQHWVLRNPQLLNTSVQKIKVLLKENTFLAEETASG